MVTRPALSFAFTLCAALGLASARARAQEPAPEGAPAEDSSAETTNTENARGKALPKARPEPAPIAIPRLHHAPVPVAEAHEDLLIEAEITHPELVRRALLFYRTAEDATVRELEFRRGTEHYVAAIPADHVRWPWIAYFIEIERLDATRIPIFASRAQPHRVEVPEDLMDVRERALYERLSGRRSVVSASGEYVSFGRSETDQIDPVTGRVNEVDVDDYYYRLEAAYTYRPLRFITEFSLKIGLLRGHSPVPVEDGTRDSDDRFKVGLNYGAPTVRIHLGDIWHAEGEFLTSVTEVGFSVGAGGAILVGDPYGSKLTLGFESIQVFGTRFYTKMDIRAPKLVTVAPMIELTNMPHARNYGLRLLGELTIDAGRGFGVGIRGGYQARLATSGGPTGGATLSYTF
jgi:hypothetical protein